jgi:hypothetical protein
LRKVLKKFLLDHQGSEYSSYDKLAKAIGPLIKKEMPSFNRTPQALIHRLRNERDKLKSQIAQAVTNLITPKPEKSKPPRPVSTFSSSNSQPSSDKKRKRSSLNNKNIGASVAGQFRDVDDRKKKKIYAGIKTNVFSIIIKIYCFVLFFRKRY